MFPVLMMMTNESYFLFLLGAEGAEAFIVQLIHSEGSELIIFCVHLFIFKNTKTENNFFFYQAIEGQLQKNK